VCLEPSYIWSHGMCKACAFKSDKYSGKIVPIKKLSDKRKSHTSEYLKLRLEYLNNHQHCEVNIEGMCKGYSTEIHHTYSGKDRNKYFLDTSTWKAVDRSCHQWIHLHPKESRDLGFLK
jgi:hypothetical protein